MTSRTSRKTKGTRTAKRAAAKRAPTRGRDLQATRAASARTRVTVRPKGIVVEGTLGGLPMRSVTGQLVIDGASDAIAWYGKAFGAKELDRKPFPDGRIMHAVLQVGDTAFMISDPLGPPGSAPKELHGAYLHIQDRDIDAMWQRAIANGATVHLMLANQFWGDRYGQLRDPFGQLWSFGWPAKMTEAEKEKLQRQAMQQMATQA